MCMRVCLCVRVRVCVCVCLRVCVCVLITCESHINLPPSFPDPTRSNLDQKRPISVQKRSMEEQMVFYRRISRTYEQRLA